MKIKSVSYDRGKIKNTHIFYSACTPTPHSLAISSLKMQLSEEKRQNALLQDSMAELVEYVSDQSADTDTKRKNFAERLVNRKQII